MAFTKVLPAGISSATNLVIDSINSAGVVTATGIVASTGTFSGNVSVAGVLTYEDVTNVDSIGIVTARSTIDAQGNVTVGAGLSAVGLSTFQNGIHVTGGSVGIGTDNPGTKLDLLNGSDADVIVQVTGADTSSEYLGLGVNGSDAIITGGGNGSTSTNLILKTAASGTETERLRISSNGAVGINTTADIRQLEIFNTSHATAALKSDTQSSLFFSDNDTNIGQISYMHSDNYMYFRVNDAERLRITSSGNVGVGSDDPQSKLDVAGEIRASGIAITESYPTILPSLNLNFARSRSMGPHVTFSRSSNATYVGRDGLVKTVGYDEPRFDHDPITGESLGFLSEEERTNSWTYSQPTSSASFGSSGTFTYNAATAPNGETEAFRLANNPAGSSSAYHRATRSINFTDDTMVLSVWAKGSGGNNYFLWSFQNLGGAIVRAGFRLEGDGETSIVTNGNGGHTLKIEKYPDGWYRCIIEANTQSSGSTTQFLYTVSGYSEGSSAAGGSTLLWGFQLEVGSFATSYIPTGSSSTTRQPDRARIVGKSFSDLFNTIEGTLVVQGRTAAGNSLQFTNQPIISINAGSTTNRIIMFDRNDGTLEWNVVDGSSANGSGVLLDSTTSYSGAADYTMCGTYKNGSPTRAVANGLGADGTNIESSGKSDTVNVFSQIDIGNELGTRECSSTIKQIRYYPLSLSDDQITTLVK